MCRSENGVLWPYESSVEERYQGRLGQVEREQLGEERADREPGREVNAQHEQPTTAQAAVGLENRFQPTPQRRLKLALHRDEVKLVISPNGLEEIHLIAMPHHVHCRQGHPKHHR
jgi:hypothetical protein